MSVVTFTSVSGKGQQQPAWVIVNGTKEYDSVLKSKDDWKIEITFLSVKNLPLVIFQSAFQNLIISMHDWCNNTSIHGTDT